MSLPMCSLQPQFALYVQQRRVLVRNLHERLHFGPKPKAQLLFSEHSSKKRFGFVSPVKSASVNGYPLHDNYSKERGLGGEDAELGEKFRNWVGLARDFLPGGSWWRLSSEDVKVEMAAEPVTVIRALQKMWELIAEERWLIFSAFAALIVTALSEISIPHFLTASIFSAKSSSVPVFYRNVRILAVLSIVAGVCRSRSFGDLTSRLGADCQQVSRVIGNDLNLILRNLLQGIGALAYLLILSWPLGLCTLAICSTILILLLLYGRYQKKAANLIQEYTASSNEVAQETLSLMRTVRVYGTEKLELRRYSKWLGKLADISMRQNAAYGFWNFSFNTLYHSMQVIAVLVGGMFILAGHISAEQLTKFILYSEWLIYSTWWVGDNVSSLMQSVGASEKVFRLMDLEPSSQLIAKGLKLQRLSGQIEFKNVSFCYPFRTTVPVLQQINFTVHPGEVVAIICVDGYPVKDLDIKWFRERIGYVGQEPRLFRTDISSNIKYGCTRNISQEDVEWAAKQAFAHDFISSLPQGYQTLVDDELLSGGQKQRIAIARALLRDPDILVLDEATSALDAESEHNVKGTLRAVRRDLNTKRTVIVIAHRLSTIQAADRIVVMDSGNIIEMGNHTELLLRDGLYARLTKRQADAVA
nr:ABC transporter B family member 26, chloroplastic [Ipomoea batatas]